MTVVAIALPACDSTGGSPFKDSVAIGPGSDEAPPAEAIVDQEPGSEPVWVDRVPAIIDPQAAEEDRAAVLDLAGATGLTAPPSEGAPVAASEETPDTSSESSYAGTMRIEIAYYNYCVTYDGNLAYAGSAEYEMAAEVYINPPAENEGIQERSPFNLIVATEAGVEGSILLVSAQVVTDTLSGESTLIDYWDIDQAGGGEISGVLTDRWPGLAFNHIETAHLLVPCRPDLGVLALRDDIAEGAELVGILTGDRVELEVLGQSLDREVRFRAVIEADLAE